MIDVITYCEDTQALVQELLEKYPDRIFKDENTGEYHFIVNKTPTVRKANKTLCLLRLTEEEYEMLQNINSLEILGTYEEIYNDEEKLAKYKSIWDYEEELTFTDENSNTHTYHRPQKFAVFA